MIFKLLIFYKSYMYFCVHFTRYHLKVNVKRSYFLYCTFFISCYFRLKILGFGVQSFLNTNFCFDFVQYKIKTKSPLISRNTRLMYTHFQWLGISLLKNTIDYLACLYSLQNTSPYSCSMYIFSSNESLNFYRFFFFWSNWSLNIWHWLY